MGVSCLVSIAQIDHSSDGSWLLLLRLDAITLKGDFRLGEDLRGLLMMIGRLRLDEGLRVIAILRAQGRNRRGWLNIVVRASSLGCVVPRSACHLL